MTKRLWPDFRYYFGICLESLMETTINLGNVVDFWANILNQGLPLATRPQVRNIRRCHTIMKTRLSSWMHKDSRIALSRTVTCSPTLLKDLLYTLILQDNRTPCQNSWRLLHCIYWKTCSTLWSSRTTEHRARTHDAYSTSYTERPAVHFDPPGQQNTVPELMTPTSLHTYTRILKPAVIIH